MHGKVAKDRATEVDKLKAATAPAEPQTLAMTGLQGSMVDDKDDAINNALPDGASAYHPMISHAEVIDVTGKRKSKASLCTPHLCGSSLCTKFTFKIPNSNR